MARLCPSLKKARFQKSRFIRKQIPRAVAANRARIGTNHNPSLANLRFHTWPQIEFQLNFTVKTRTKRPDQPVVSRLSSHEGFANLVDKAGNPGGGHDHSGKWDV